MEIIRDNYRNCTIKKTNLKAGKSNVYYIQHNKSYNVSHGVGLAESFRIARLLDLDYSVSKFFSLEDWEWEE